MYLWQIRRNVHSSWLIACLSFGIVVGIIALQYEDARFFSSFIWLIVSCTLAAIGLWRGTAYALLFMIIAGGIIGFWRGSAAQNALASYDNLNGRVAIVTGKVSEDVDKGKGGELIVRLEDITIEGHDLEGKLWVSLVSTADIKRSDIVTIKGKLDDGFGSFAASVYRGQLESIKRPEPGDMAGRARDWFAGSIRSSISEPEASLGIGFLVGQRRSLPEELDSALRVAGLMHIVVASGYNLTILVRLARRAFVKVSKYLAAFSSMSMIIAFIAVTGMSPSMSRAGLVSGLSLLAWYYGRKFHPLVLLPFAAAITLLITPSYGWGDLGWQLSFAAFAGVMVLAPLADRYFYGDSKPGMIRQILGETLAAQIVTLPILVVAFGQFSNVATIANMLIVPLVPLAMLLTFVAGIGSLVMPSAAVLFGTPASWLLHYMTTVAEYTAGLSWAQTTITVSAAVAGLYYALVILACFYMSYKTKFSLREKSIVE